MVSIITPLYNNQDTLEDCIASIINQSYEYWELILIDDASTDGSLNIARQVASLDSRVKVLSHSFNKGAAQARNSGTTMASGDYIAFLDADDIWYPNKLEKQLEYLQEYDVCYSSYDLMDQYGRPTNRTIESIPYLTLNKLHRANYIGNLTGVYNVKKLGKIYTKDLRKRQDWLLWIEALSRSKKPAYGIKESLASYRMGNSSLSSNKLNLIKHNFRVYNQGLGYSFIKSAYCLVRFVIEQVFVKSRQVKIKS